jgi:hypothetical protein
VFFVFVEWIVLSVFGSMSTKFFYQRLFLIEVLL